MSQARRLLVLLHRWVGLALTAFLLVAGATGAVLAWYDELQAVLTPEQVAVPVEERPMLEPWTLRARAEAYAGVPIHEIPLGLEPGAVYNVWPHVDRGPGLAAWFQPGWVRLWIHPYSGELLGRNDGYWPLNRHKLLDFVYDLHWMLALGDAGMWLMGFVALAWTLDCFVGLWLTLPPSRRRGRVEAARGWWSRWAPAWRVKREASAYRRWFDLHRAGGLWTWALLLVLAWSSVQFNLNVVYQPVMAALTDMGTSAEPAPLARPMDGPPVPWPEALATARRLLAQAARAGHFAVLRESALAFDADTGSYVYTVYSDRDVAGKRRGATQLRFRAETGEVLAVELPTGRHAGATISHWLLALHTARVGGAAMQLALCAMGLVVVLLGVSGVVVWQRKRAARAWA